MSALNFVDAHMVIFRLNIVICITLMYASAPEPGIGYLYFKSSYNTEGKGT